MRFMYYSAFLFVLHCDTPGILIPQGCDLILITGSLKAISLKS